MRMFQSISGHSSDQSAAHYSARPTISQLKGSSTLFQINLRMTDHRGHKSTVTNAPFCSKLESNGLRVDRSRKFTEVFFSVTPAVFKATSKLFGSLSCCDDNESDLTFPAFSLRFVHFAVQFSFCCRFSFHEKRRSGQV